MAKKHKRIEPVHVGELRDDLVQVVKRIVPLLIDGPHVVWADDSALIYCAPADGPDVIPGPWICGIYTIGQAQCDIEADLRALLRDRAKDWIID